MHDVVELHATGKDWKSSHEPASPSSGGVDNGAQYSEGMKVQDSADMRRMGKKQEFRRNFNVISISSFCLAVMMGFVFIPMYVLEPNRVHSINADHLAAMAASRSRQQALAERSSSSSATSSVCSQSSWVWPRCPPSRPLRGVSTTGSPSSLHPAGRRCSATTAAGFLPWHGSSVLLALHTCPARLSPQWLLLRTPATLLSHGTRILSLWLSRRWSMLSTATLSSTCRSWKALSPHI